MRPRPFIPRGRQSNDMASCPGPLRNERQAGSSHAHDGDARPFTGGRISRCVAATRSRLSGLASLIAAEAPWQVQRNEVLPVDVLEECKDLVEALGCG